MLFKDEMNNSIFKSSLKSISKMSLAFIFLIGHIAEVNAQSITEYKAFIGDKKSEPTGLALDKKGNIWFTTRMGDRIGKMTPSGVVTEYREGLTPHPEHKTGIRNITLGLDGNMWFLEVGCVAKIDANGKITEFGKDTLSRSGNLENIVAGPDGNVWFVGGNVIRKITPDGIITEYRDGITEGATLTGIVAGRDENLWFTDQMNHSVGRITLNGKVTKLSDGLSNDAMPSVMTSDANGTAWFVEKLGEGLGKISKSGVITEYSIYQEPDDYAVVPAIATGADNDIWVVYSSNRRLGKIKPGGESFTYGLVGQDSGKSVRDRDGDRLGDIINGNDGSLWFADTGRGRIGRVYLHNPLLSGFDQSDTTEAVVAKMKSPQTVIDLVKNVRIAISLHLPERPDFYTDAILKKVFGIDAAGSIIRRDTLPYNNNSSIYANANTLFSGISIAISMSLDSQSGTHSNLTLRAAHEGELPDFDAIEEFFGANWSYDLIWASDGPSESAIRYREGNGRENEIDIYLFSGLALREIRYFKKEKNKS